MKITVESGKIQIVIAELLEAMTEHEQVGLIDTLSCEEAVIKNVADQLLDGWTEAGSYGLMGGAEAEPCTALEKARRRIALAAGDVARKEIEDLCATLRREKAYHDQHNVWAWSMYHAMDNPPFPPSAFAAHPGEYEVVRKAK